MCSYVRVRRNIEVEATLVAKFVTVSPELNERGRRVWAAAEAVAIGYGGDALVSSATGLARETIRKGRREIARGVVPVDRQRRPGAGRPRIQTTQPGITEALEALVDPLTRGDPTSPLRWTCKSRAKLAAALTQRGWRVSSTTVGRLLRTLGYSLQAAQKRREGTAHPDRNAQFEHINATAVRFLRRRQPVISVDTKKKELVGPFKNAGREWQPTGQPEAVLVHDFPTDACGKAIPYGVYDMTRNEAWVSVGCDHDTPAFAVASIRHWWTRMGRRAHPNATALFITADAGGSNGYRARAWKLELQQFADESHLRIRVSHFPPGTSKWNKMAISEFPKWRKYLILLSFLDNSSARPVQIGGIDVNICHSRSTAVRGRRRSSSQSPPRGPFCRTRTGPVEADGAVDAQNAPTAPWKTLCVFHELPQGLSHQVTHEKLRKAPKYRWETRIDPTRSSIGCSVTSPSTGAGNP